MPNIFISYRRSDSQGWAGRLSDTLRLKLKNIETFRDVENLPPGQEYKEYLSSQISKGKVLIVLIGPAWLNAKDKNGNRRLDNINDYVRMEISYALQKKLTVLPVLVGAAQMPTAEDLPDNLKNLVNYNAFELSDNHWAAASDKLIEHLRKTCGYKFSKLYLPFYFLLVAALTILGIFIIKTGNFDQGKTAYSEEINEIKNQIEINNNETRKLTKDLQLAQTELNDSKNRANQLQQELDKAHTDKQIEELKNQLKNANEAIELEEQNLEVAHSKLEKLSNDNIKIQQALEVAMNEQEKLFAASKAERKEASTGIPENKPDGNNQSEKEKQPMNMENNKAPSTENIGNETVAK